MLIAASGGKKYWQSYTRNLYSSFLLLNLVAKSPTGTLFTFAILIGSNKLMINAETHQLSITKASDGVNITYISITLLAV